MNILGTVLLLTYFALGGIFYMIRGGGIGSDYTDANGVRQGGLLNISAWLKRNGLPSLRDLFLIALFLMPAINVAYLFLLGITGWATVAITTSLSVGYIVAFVSGWGEYFDIGQWKLYYRNHRENFLVDWVLFKIYGPEWIPKNAAVTPDNPDFDLIASPTGEINPESWRVKRDFTGMALRHLFSLAIFGSLGLVKHYFLAATWTTTIYTAALTVPFAIGVALIYYYYRTTKQIIWPTVPKYRFQEATGRAEFATGIWLHVLIVVAMLVL